MSNIIPSKAHALAGQMGKTPRYAMKNGMIMPDTLQQKVIAVPPGQLPLLMKYDMAYDNKIKRFNFAKAFVVYLLHKELNTFRPSERLTDAFYIDRVEHEGLFNSIYGSGFGKSPICIINTATLQMQNGRGAILGGSQWEVVLGTRLKALIDSLDNVRKSELQQVHIATERA